MSSDEEVMVGSVPSSDDLAMYSRVTEAAVRPWLDLVDGLRAAGMCNARNESHLGGSD